MNTAATMTTLGRSMITLMTLIAMTLGALPQALAKSPEATFKGQIIVSAKRFPSKFKSDAEFVAHMKKVKTQEIFAKAEGEWSFDYMVFSPQPVGSLQAAVTFYDVTTPGTKKLTNTFTFYPQNSKDKTLNGFAELTKEGNFAEDRKYVMEFSRGYGQKALASTTIVLRAAK